MSEGMRYAIQQFLDRGLGEYAPSTRANVRRDMTLWKETLGGASPDVLTVRQLKRLLREDMAPSTARRRLASLRMAYKWWTKRGIVKNNHLEDLLSDSSFAFPFLHTGIHRTRYLSAADAQRILQAAQGHLHVMEVYHFLLPALLLSGLRMVEILSLSRVSLQNEKESTLIQIGPGRRIPLSSRIPVGSFHQGLALLGSLRSSEDGLGALFPFGRTPAERILKTLCREAGVPATASSLRWRGIMDHLEQGMNVGVASLLFDVSKKNLQRQFRFYQ
jgi:integrase